MAEVIWTETALSDLDNIAAYIALDSEYYAKQFIAQIFKATDKLKKYSEAGRTLPELPKLQYREIHLKKYRIIYRINISKVYIITVHHSSRLLENNEHFKGFFGDL